mgnify:CR=1 FL=1
MRILRNALLFGGVAIAGAGLLLAAGGHDWSTVHDSHVRGVFGDGGGAELRNRTNTRALTDVWWDAYASLALAPFVEPRIEPEVVFKLAAPPPDTTDPRELLGAIEWIAPGFEIVQSHLPGWKFVAAQTVADNGLHARLHVGSRVAIAEVAREASHAGCVHEWPSTHTHATMI